jgi:uncharacterized protein (DUF58 family)
VHRQHAAASSGFSFSFGSTVTTLHWTPLAYLLAAAAGWMLVTLLLLASRLLITPANGQTLARPPIPRRVRIVAHASQSFGASRGCIASHLGHWDGLRRDSS